MTAIADLLAWTPPGLLLIVLGTVVAVFPGRPARAVGIVVPLALLVQVLAADPVSHQQARLLGHAVSLYHLDAISRPFAAILLFATALAGLYAMNTGAALKERIAFQLLAGSAVSAVTAGDLVTLFVFLQTGVAASVFLVWSRGTERARAAGMRYLVFLVLAGVVMLEGLASNVLAAGSGQPGSLGDGGPGTLLIGLALLAYCGAPLLHSWMTDACPEATTGGLVILPIFITLVAVHALLRHGAGNEYLLAIGAVMAVYPLLFSVFEHDLRRILMYGLITQVGFMLAGIGTGSDAAINAVVLHAVTFPPAMMIMLMGTGAVLLRTGSSSAAELGFLWPAMPVTAALTVIGAASLAAVPLFAGFVSQSWIIDAVRTGTGQEWTRVLLVSGAALTVPAIAFRVPWLAFRADAPEARVPEAPFTMLAAMAAAAVACMAIGIAPGMLHSLLPYPPEADPHDLDGVLRQLVLISAAMLVFVLFLRKFLETPREPVTVFGVDWIWRRGLARLALRLGGSIERARVVIVGGLMDLAGFVIGDSRRHFGSLGAFGRTIGIGNGVAWIVVLLLVALVASYATA